MTLIARSISTAPLLSDDQRKNPRHWEVLSGYSVLDPREKILHDIAVSLYMPNHRLHHGHGAVLFIRQRVRANKGN